MAKAWITVNLIVFSRLGKLVNANLSQWSTLLPNVRIDCVALAEMKKINEDKWREEETWPVRSNISDSFPNWLLIQMIISILNKILHKIERTNRSKSLQWKSFFVTTLRPKLNPKLFNRRLIIQIWFVFSGDDSYWNRQRHSFLEMSIRPVHWKKYSMNEEFYLTWIP